MELKDFIVTPIFILIIFFVAWYFRHFLAGPKLQKYFFSSITLKIFGSLSLGLIYQFYYETGDTFAYHTHGSRLIWEAWMNNPIDGLRLIFFIDKAEVDDLFQYTNGIWYFRNLGPSYNVCRIAGLIDIFTFSTYSSTAIVFGLWSLSGWWYLFKLLLEWYKGISSSLLFLAIFLVPSVIVWGSGLLKDSLALGSLGWLIGICFSVINGGGKVLPFHVILGGISIYLLVIIKIYILLSLIPVLGLFMYLSISKQISSSIWKVLIQPILLGSAILLIYYMLELISQENERYSIENIAITAKITAYDLRYGWGARFGENSGYSLGALDGSWISMIRLLPSAINVTLFRPYLWEVKNPLMLLSALESFLFFVIVLILICRKNTYIRLKEMDPFIWTSIIFVLGFAFAVGVSTYNFGTLARYKIPIYPFFSIVLVFLYTKSPYVIRKIYRRI